MALLIDVLKKILKFCKKCHIKKDIKMGKYNIAINVLFWTLIVFLLFIALFYMFYKGDGFNFTVSGQEETKPEEVIVKEFVEVEKEVEWYYFVASGYSSNDSAQGTNNITATGKEIEKGMVAVDPKVITLGTRIEIKDMGVFVAEDTGGKIKGNRIDIYFNSKGEAKKFGIKGIWVKIIDNSYNLADLSENDRYISRYMSK